MADEGKVAPSKEISSHYKTLPPPLTPTPALSSRHQGAGKEAHTRLSSCFLHIRFNQLCFLGCQVWEKGVSVFREGCGNQLFPPPPSCQQGRRVLLEISVHSCQVLTQNPRADLLKSRCYQGSRAHGVLEPLEELPLTNDWQPDRVFFY